MANDFQRRKRFREIFDELTVGLVDFLGKVIPLGCIHLNALNALKPLDDDDLEEFRKNINGQKEAGETTDETEILSPSCSNLPRAFEIDNACQNGRVVLMYINNYTNPQVWFQDLGCDWNYVADSFENYFRLVILHMGILHWLYAFTEVGLDPITQQTKTRKSKTNKKVNLAKIDRIVRKHGRL